MTEPENRLIEILSKVPQLISKNWTGSHLSSNIDSLKNGFQQRDLGISIARNKKEELSSPTVRDSEGVKGRVEVHVTGKGLDYTNSTHKKWIEDLYDCVEKLKLAPYDVTMIETLRSLDVDWVNGWNGIGQSNELHVLNVWRIKITKRSLLEPRKNLTGIYQKFLDIGMDVRPGTIFERKNGKWVLVESYSFPKGVENFLLEIFTALRIMKNKGFPIPGILRPEHPETGRSETIYATWAKVGHIRGTLTVSLHKDLIDKKEEIQKTVFHECGHLYHYLHNKKLWAKDMTRHLTDKDLHPFETDTYQVRTQVSDYALESPLEYVAEVFAGIMTGKKYGLKIMAVFHFFLYENWKPGYKI